MAKLVFAFREFETHAQKQAPTNYNTNYSHKHTHTHTHTHNIKTTKKGQKETNGFNWTNIG